MITAPPSVVGEATVQNMLELLATVPDGGCIVEVGVYKGGTLWYLVGHSKGRPVYGYDTFRGIPFSSKFDQHKVGDFGDTSIDEVSDAIPEAILTAGIFPDSALRMPPVAFAHIDCDQYESIKRSIEYLQDKMMLGGVMWFDDYCLPSGKKAVDEMLGDKIKPTGTGQMYVRF